MTKKRAAIYARISTNEARQNPETQLRQLRQFVKRRGFTVTAEYIDQASGARTDRVQYKKLLEDARKRRIDVVLVWRYDRFARSTVELVSRLEEFHALGVDFISHQEAVDTTTPHGRLFFTIAAGFAEFERSLISARVKAGMERARAAGKKIGRSPLPDSKRREVKQLRKKHPKASLRDLGRRAKVSKDSVARTLR